MPDDMVSKWRKTILVPAGRFEFRVLREKLEQGFVSARHQFAINGDTDEQRHDAFETERMSCLVVASNENCPPGTNLLANRDLAEPVPFDLYIATSHQQATSLAPVVVLIHGGPISQDWATTPKQWRAFQSIGELLGASGLNAVMFDHRFHHREETAPTIDDIDVLLTHIGANAIELGVDGSRSLGVLSGRNLPCALSETPTGRAPLPCGLLRGACRRQTRTVGGMSD
jgi:hypothetical protein